MAERIAGKLFPDYHFSSAGVRATPGEPASSGALAVMAARGIDLSTHRSRLLGEQQVEEADLVLCMTQAHRDLISRSVPGHSGKLKVLRQCAGLMPEDLADPFGGTRADYEQCAAQIEEALAKLRLAHANPCVIDH